MYKYAVLVLLTGERGRVLGEVWPVDVPNLKALQDELENELAAKLVAVFGRADRVEDARADLRSVLSAHNAQGEGNDGHDQVD